MTTTEQTEDLGERAEPESAVDGVATAEPTAGELLLAGYDSRGLRYALKRIADECDTEAERCDMEAEKVEFCDPDEADLYRQLAANRRHRAGVYRLGVPEARSLILSKR